MNKPEWYFILFLLVLIALIWLNEAGYGATAFLPLMLLAAILINQIYKKEKPSA